MFESYDQPMATRRVFLRRVLRQVAFAVVPLVISLFVGWVGYMLLAQLGPIDAFLNAAMILGGMGPVDVLTNDAAKIFAGLYAVYSGVFFLVIAGLILAPFFHRVMHRLHLPADDEAVDATDKPAKRGTKRTK
ncbi:MAG: hypothetical protein ABI744_08380 [Chloroflexota bacterium]